MMNPLYYLYKCTFTFVICKIHAVDNLRCFSSVLIPVEIENNFLPEGSKLAGKKQEGKERN